MNVQSLLKQQQQRYDHVVPGGRRSLLAPVGPPDRRCRQPLRWEITFQLTHQQATDEGLVGWAKVITGAAPPG
jgi:hypothetical protein